MAPKFGTNSKKTTSKEHKAKQAKGKEPTRPQGFVGKLCNIDGPDGPTITGTNVLVADVLTDLDGGDSHATVCRVHGIEPGDVAACLEWRAKPEAERDAIGDTEPPPANATASEPPNPDEPSEPLPQTTLEVRKVETSTIVPGGPIVLERLQRTLLVSLTEAELEAKRKEVFVASRTLRDANDKLVAVKAEIKRVTEHERALHAIIDRGQEDRSVQCERVLEGTFTKLYRVDRLECIESRPAMQHERQLTLAE